jgi:hypothetical protein
VPQKRHRDDRLAWWCIYGVVLSSRWRMKRGRMIRLHSLLLTAAGRPENRSVLTTRCWCTPCEHGEWQSLAFSHQQKCKLITPILSTITVDDKNGLVCQRRTTTARPCLVSAYSSAFPEFNDSTCFMPRLPTRNKRRTIRQHF